MDRTGNVRPGGRTARTRAAVLAAVVGELAEHGWDQVSVESVAQRAGVHKTTVYRRWGDKNTLVTDVLTAAADDRIGSREVGVGERRGRFANRVVEVFRRRPDHRAAPMT